MSRCFPYPPPGFIIIGNKASDEALIDSIKPSILKSYSGALKLQKVEKANKEQWKEKRKEKIEKSKEKKEKKRLKKENKERVGTNVTEIGHETDKDDKHLAELEGENSRKRKYEDIEQLEGSSVTEEYGQPLNLQNPSYSSDSTQNFDKRRLQVSFANDSFGHGNIIRIKLPLQKHKESRSTVSKKHLSSTSGANLLNKEHDVIASKELCCATSGRIEMHKQQNWSGSDWTVLDYSRQDVRTSQVDTFMNSLRNNSVHGLPSGPSNEMCCPTAAYAEVLAQAHSQITYSSVPGSCSTSLDKNMLKRNSQYSNLIQNLYQMALPHELVDNDEEWLFGGNPLHTLLNKTNAEKQFAVSSDVTCSGSSKKFPCSRYLQEVEIFALPYTVPF